MISHWLECVRLLRIQHATKNFFIIMPLLFAGQLFETPLLFLNLLAIVAFSLIAGGVYIFNDIQDVAHDRLHPEKKNRPLAAGSVTKHTGVLLCLFLLGLGLSSMFYLSLQALVVSLIYVLMNVWYSLQLKNYMVIDVCVVALGFVLRLLVGAAVSQVHLSFWIVLMTFLLALFIALAKRRDDVILFNTTGQLSRTNIVQYSIKALDVSLLFLAVIILCTYIIYTVAPENTGRLQSKYVFTTSVFVALGLWRYLHLTWHSKAVGNPVKLLFNDKYLLWIVGVWLLFFSWLIYR